MILLLAQTGSQFVDTVTVWVDYVLKEAMNMSAAMIEVIASRPELGAITISGLLVVSALSYRRSRPAQNSEAETFLSLLRTQSRVAVLMHPNPDPDAMASALGVKELAASVDTTATLYYTGEIRHQENRAFRAVLDTNFQQITGAGEIEAQSNVILVDHHTPRELDNDYLLDTISILDHHPGGHREVDHCHIDVSLGACSTILSDYFQALGIAPDGSENGGSTTMDTATVSTQVATALTYGILSDTANLTRAHEKSDVEAVAYLTEGVDKNALSRISTPNVQKAVLDAKAKAIRQLEIRAVEAVSDIGTITNRDALPQAADELITVEGAESVIAMANCDGKLYLSGRSDDDRVHMGNVISKAVEDITDASAGGHATMGGGYVPAEHIGENELTSEITRQALIERLFSSMKGKSPS